MPRPLVPCPACERGVRPQDTSCVYCGAALPTDFWAHSQFTERASQRRRRALAWSALSLNLAGVACLAVPACGTDTLSLGPDECGLTPSETVPAAESHCKDFECPADPSGCATVAYAVCLDGRYHECECAPVCGYCVAQGFDASSDAADAEPASDAANDAGSDARLDGHSDGASDGGSSSDVLGDGPSDASRDGRDGD